LLAITFERETSDSKIMADKEKRIQYNARIAPKYKRMVKGDTFRVDKLTIDQITECIIEEFYARHPLIEDRKRIFKGFQRENPPPERVVAELVAA
jgi:hypothetical protein